MKKPEKETTERFDSLINTCLENLRNVVIENGHGTVIISGDVLPMTINAERTVGWGLNSLNLISSVFGESSTYYKRFDEIYPKFCLEENRDDVKNALAILIAAKDDYENGFIKNIPEESIVPEVFESQLNTNQIKEGCDKEAKRNSRIYLVFISTAFIFVISTLYYFFGLAVASLISFGLLILGFIVSCFLLKEITFSKLPERLLEYEKDRIYKRFGIESNK
jgi:hypothetical protein